jgi:hypothetical protein
MTKPSNAEYLAQHRAAVQKVDGTQLWQMVLVGAVMDRLPSHLSLRDELISDLRARAEMTDDPIVKAGLKEALRQLIAL